MYSINTLKIDEDKLQITLGYESKVIGEKILELSFNENKTPTFVESGCIYLTEDFDKFIKIVDRDIFDTNIIVSFSFDDQDRFDGFEIIRTIKNQIYLVIKTSYERACTSIWIELTKDTKSGIVSDLNYLRSQIDAMIESQLKYLEILSNPYNHEECIDDN